MNKAVPLLRTGILLVAGMAVLELLRLVIFPDELMLGMAVALIAALLSIVTAQTLTAQVSGQKYALLSSLPIKMKNVPRLIFRLYELTVAGGFLLCFALSLAFGKTAEALVLLLVGAVFTLVGYGMLLLNAAPEYASGIGSGAKAFGIMAVYFVIGIASGILSGIGSEREIKFSPAVYFIALGVLSAAALVIRRFAFKKYISIVRILKKG